MSSGPEAVSQQRSSCHTRDPWSSCPGSWAGQRRQTDGGASSGPGQRGGPTMYTVAVGWGARYLTRFSTEYTEM